MLALICGGILARNVDSLFALSGPELEKARRLMEILTASMALSLLSTVFNCVMSAREQFLFQQLLQFLQSVLNPFLTLPLLLMGCGSVGMVLVSFVLTAGRFLWGAWYCIRRLGMRFSFRNIRLSLLAEIGAFTFFIFLNQIVDQINWSLDKVLLGRFAGTAAVAVYGVGSQLHSMYLNFSVAVSAMFVPQVNRLVASGAPMSVLDGLFARVGRIQFLILMLLLTGFGFFGQSFLALWSGPEYARAYPVALVLMLAVSVDLIQNIGIEIQRAMNRHQARSVVYACIACGNVLISIPLIRHYGVVGAAVGTAIALVLGTVVFMNWYYHCRLHLDMFRFWGQIGRILPSLLLPLAAGFWLHRDFPIRSWGDFVTAAAVYSLVYGASVWAFGMNSSEKSLITGIFHRLFRPSAGKK